MSENPNNNLICSKCGTSYTPNTKFCIKCGNNLQSNSVATSSVSVPKAEQNINNSGQQPINNNVSANIQAVPVTNGKFKIFQYIMGAVLKPFDSFKKDEENLNNFKNGGILALVVVCFTVIVELIIYMTKVVKVTSIYSDEVTWVWENLKEIEYFKVIGQSLLMYAGMIFVIAGVYFLASLVVKKEAKFPKVFGATVTAFIPYVIAGSVLSPILSLIYYPLGSCITLVGVMYALVILLELMNELIKIENKNTRIYFHLTCLSILIIGYSFIIYYVATSGLNNLL